MIQGWNAMARQPNTDL